MPNQKKKEIVAKIEKLIKEAQAIFLADYSTLSANQINQLRNNLKENQARLMIIKNRLFKLALAAINKDVAQKIEEKGIFQGPIAAIFSQADEILPLKTVAQFKQEEGKENPTFKLGFNQKQIYSAEEINQLIKLPDKQTLQAQVVGALNNPVYGLVNSLSWSMKQLIWTLQSLQESKP